MIGPSLGPTLGGWITDNYSWHWIFLINVPLGLLAASLCASTLRDPPGCARAARRRGRLARASRCWSSAIGSLQTVLERGHKDDWFESPTHPAGSPSRPRSARSASWSRELTAEHPVVDLRVLRRPALAVGCALGVLMGVGLYGSIFLFPVYTQSLLHWTAWQSGLAVLPSSITTAVMMIVCGRLIWRVGPRAHARRRHAA